MKIKDFTEWLTSVNDNFLGRSHSQKNDMDAFMKEVNEMDVDPLVLDRFLHEGFDTNIETFNIYLKVYYQIKSNGQM